MVKESLVTAGESKAACDRMVFTMDKEYFWDCCLVDLNNAGGLKRRDEAAGQPGSHRLHRPNRIRTKENAYSQTSGLVILYCNLIADGAVVKKGAILDDKDDISL